MLEAAPADSVTTKLIKHPTEAGWGDEGRAIDGGKNITGIVSILVDVAGWGMTHGL